MTKEIDTAEYASWILEMKSRIRVARNKVALSINAQLLELYWNIGKDIAEKQQASTWGSGFIEQVARDLRHEFPDMTGFSRRNLYAIRQWYLFYVSQFKFVPQAVAQIPWGHNRMIVSKTATVDEAMFYTVETAKHGWNRDTLEIQIETKLFERQGRASNNFTATLPATQSKIAKEVLKDPYNFDFLGLQDDVLEREIEKELTRNIRDFLLELGKGSAFVGSQYKIEISETDYFIDLLFFHLELRSYVVVELKAGRFKPEFAGKLNFYLSAVDSQLKQPQDNSTIGILLCKN